MPSLILHRGDEGPRSGGVPPRLRRKRTECRFSTSDQLTRLSPTTLSPPMFGEKTKLRKESVCFWQRATRLYPHRAT